MGSITHPVTGFFGAQGDWKPGRRYDSKFVAKYGSLFEDTRGPPMVQVRPTYCTDPITGRVDRGIFLPGPEEPLFRLFGKAVYASSLTGYAIVIEAVRLGMYAVLLVGVDT